MTTSTMTAAITTTTITKFTTAATIIVTATTTITKFTIATTTTITKSIFKKQDEKKATFLALDCRR